MTFLTPHFTLEELVRSDTATRLGIENIPTQTYINNLILVCQHILEPVWEYYVGQGGYSKVQITSGYRSLALNMAINPMTTTLTKVSKHCFGQAADFEVPGVANGDLAIWCRDNLPEFEQIILEFYTPGVPTSGWVHGAYVVGDQRMQCLTASRVYGKTVYSEGINP